VAVNKKNAKGAAIAKSPAVQLALKALQNEAVQAQLKAAPAAVGKWAADRRAQRSEAHDKTPLSKIGPLASFGQSGLERRVAKLQETVALAVGDRSASTRPELWTALDEISRAVTVAAGLPLVKRKKLQMRIDDDLDDLEMAIIDAVLPRD